MIKRVTPYSTLQNVHQYEVLIACLVSRMQNDGVHFTLFISFHLFIFTITDYVIKWRLQNSSEKNWVSKVNI